MFGISPQGVGLPWTILSFVVSLVTARFFDDPPAEVQEMVENIRYPK